MPERSDTGHGRRCVIEHGGDLAAAEAAFGRPEEDWIDLSTGINPHPYPVGTPPLEAWTRLPDSGVVRRLREAAAGYYGVSDSACVVPAAGTQSLIQWLPRIPKRTRVAVLAPTYNEHAAAWAAAGHEVTEVGDPADLVSGPPVAVVVNPNNPDGRRLDPDFLETLARNLGKRRGLLVVDEAFADVAPEISVAGRVGVPGLLVLRSFGKFFGLAGARLGFALAWPAMAAALGRVVGPWAVPGPGASVAAGALGNEAWIAITRQGLAEGMARLRSLLKENGLEVVGGTDLFVLAATEGARELYAHLAREGILTRRFPAQETWIRFGLPPEDGWARLEEALRAWPRRP